MVDQPPLSIVSRRVRRGRPRSSPFLLAMLAVLSLNLVSGCSDWGNNSKTQQRMFQSTGKYAKGYSAGNRDAQWAITDISGAWLWLWAADQEYQQGYEQGWSDGRELAKLKARQNEQDNQE